MSAFAYVARGDERFEEFHSSILRKQMVQYDYRSHDGRLFSTIAPTLSEARTRRDKWIRQNEAFSPRTIVSRPCGA